MWTLTEMHQAYGYSAVAQIPEHPDYVQLVNDADKPVYLSRMRCKLHFALVSPDTIAADLTKTLDAPTHDERKTMKARAAYDKLMNDAYEGKDVKASAAAEAQVAIRLEELAEQGRMDRAHAAAVKAELDARIALEGPALERLTAAQERLQGLADTAYTAMVALLNGVDENMAEHDAVLGELIAGGFEASELRLANGYVQTTIVGTHTFPYHPKAEWLLAVLHQLKASRQHTNAYNGVGGRNIGKELPFLTDGGPRITPEAAK